MTRMLSDLIEDRHKKLRKIKEAGANPYPARVLRTHGIRDVREHFDALVRAKKRIVVVGRILGIRDQGKVMFLDLADRGGKIQIVAKKDAVKDFDFGKSVLDRGDFAEVGGIPFCTQRGEESVEAASLRIIAKALRPMPTEWYGIEDEELRLRERYLEFTLHPEVREMFEKKSVFWNSFREYLVKDGFLEVETPVLESIPGGAEAEPFKTYHHALDTDFYLRISLELALKKLLVGGFEKVFEIGRVFRNEGIDREHLQDYTQLEFYRAYADYEDLMKFTEKLYEYVIKATCGTLKATYNGQRVDWGKKWKKVDYVEIFKEKTKIDPRGAKKDELITWYRGYLSRQKTRDKFVTETQFSIGRLIDMIFKKAIRPSLIDPCFLVNPPVEVEPLAKRSQEDPRVVERFQVIACGTELGKGYSELNDPLDQRARFEEQEKARAAGDKEAERLDEDYLTAMEYGMPPAAGFGVSERLFAVLMDKPVRETVMFPLMRPKK